MNFVYVVDLDGWRTLHEGDSSAPADECAAARAGGDAVDLAVVHFWRPLEPTFARVLAERAPRRVALRRLPVRNEAGAWPAQIRAVRKAYIDMFLMLPGLPEKVFSKDTSGAARTTNGRRQFQFG